ncbi:hypothetical protein U0070_011801 [Myodes glareolus]|uniref:Arf-GAP with coiled-coil, ANK repeat and PH domain-containing protein n=1 Tax=Myodes glareolus TaxID=447135 RepID=A0AAW0I319_MYOGA
MLRILCSELVFKVIHGCLTKFIFPQINVLQSKRRSEILKSMLSFMYAHLAFFHQGYDLFSELGPYMKDLGAQLDRLVVDAAKEKREMEQKHSTIQQKVWGDLEGRAFAGMLVNASYHCCTGPSVAYSVNRSFCEKQMC